MYDIFIYLAEPLTFPFIQRALLLGITIAVVCALLSCYLMLKGWSLIGDAISHALLPGIILSHFIGIPIAIGALVASLFSTTLMGSLKNQTKLKEDNVIGIVFSMMFALGLFLFGIIETELHITHILFGNILAIDKHSLVQSMLLLFVILSIMLVKSKDILLFCFDEKQMAMQGMSVKFHHYLLLCLLALVIVFSVQAIGVLFIVGLLIIPGMFGFTLSKQFHFMAIIACSFSAITVFIGILSSYYLDVASAPLIIVTQALFLLVALLITFKMNRIAQA